jgi:hypothetical protein
MPVLSEGPVLAAGAHDQADREREITAYRWVHWMRRSEGRFIPAGFSRAISGKCLVANSPCIGNRQRRGIGGAMFGAIFRETDCYSTATRYDEVGQRALLSL